MKTLLFIALATTFTLVATSCQKPQRHYEGIGFGGSYEIVGISPLKKAPTNRPHYTFSYDSDNRLARIVYGIGDQLQPDPFFGVSQIAFEYSPEGERRLFLDSLSNLMLSPQHRHAVVVLPYDDKGITSGLRFYGTNLLPASDHRGVYAYKWERDEQGRITRTSGFDTNGNLQESAGVAIVEAVFDNRGNMVEQRNYDRNTNLTRDRFWGVAVIKNVYNERNQLIEMSVFDEHRQPVNYNFWNIHKKRHLHDEKGNLTNTIRYSVSNGELVVAQ